MNFATSNRPGKRMSRTAGLLAFALAASSIAQEPTFRARSNVVSVPVLVRDERGQAVYGLNATDFLVRDDGVAQTVQMDEAAESEPISMVVALQTGRRASREFGRMRGLAAMLEPILAQPGSRVALVEFDGAVNLAQNFSHDPAGITTALQHLEPGDGGAGDSGCGSVFRAPA